MYRTHVHIHTSDNNPRIGITPLGTHDDLNTLEDTGVNIYIRTDGVVASIHLSPLTLSRFQMSNTSLWSFLHFEPHSRNIALYDKDDNNVACLDIALRRGHRQIVELLRQTSPPSESEPRDADLSHAPAAAAVADVSRVAAASSVLDPTQDRRHLQQATQESEPSTTAPSVVVGVDMEDNNDGGLAVRVPVEAAEAGKAVRDDIRYDVDMDVGAASETSTDPSASLSASLSESLSASVPAPKTLTRPKRPPVAGAVSMSPGDALLRSADVGSTPVLQGQREGRSRIDIMRSRGVLPPPCESP